MRDFKQKTELVTAQVLVLVMVLAFAAVIILDALKAFGDGRWEWWFWSRLPFDLVFFFWPLLAIFLVLGWRIGEKVGRRNDYLSWVSRYWYSSQFMIYIVISCVGTSLSQTFLPINGWAIYAAVYWILICVTVVSVSWFVVASARGVMHGRTVRRGLAILLVLAGLASGPMAGLWWRDGGLGVNSPASAVIALFAVTPIVLLLIFRPLFSDGLPSFIIK